MFLGTPHQGAPGVSWGEILVSVASIFTKTNQNLLQHLKRDSEWLQQQLQQYTAISNEFVTKFAYETYKTPIALGKSILVRLFADTDTSTRRQVLLGGHRLFQNPRL